MVVNRVIKSFNVMKKRILAATALILSTITVFSGANKFGSVSTLYYTDGGLLCRHFVTSSPGKFTTGGTGEQVLFATSNGSIYALWGTCVTLGGNAIVANPVHFNL